MRKRRSVGGADYAEWGGQLGGRWDTCHVRRLVGGRVGYRPALIGRPVGGAQVMAGFTTMNVGERNTQFVLDYLATERIPIVSQDVLDIHPRKVCFFPVTGKALVKRLAHAHPETLAVEERRGNAASVAKSTAGDSVDLF